MDDRRETIPGKRVTSDESRVTTAKQLHERVMACWAKYQALSLELLALEGRVADCWAELKAVAKDIYELYQRADAALDDGPPQTEQSQIENQKS
jgi:hypothetical protein